VRILMFLCILCTKKRRFSAIVVFEYQKFKNFIYFSKNLIS
jgi:hypothetical protein